MKDHGFKCKVDGCERMANYLEQGVCQKHYFRNMRNGTYDTIISRKYRTSNPAGYQKIAEPWHPLADSKGSVYEHRFVYHTQVDDNPTECAMCSAEISWDNCHIDHIDSDVTNNKKENLRALCRSCNVFRGHTSESMGKNFLTIDGVTLTANAWARMPGVEVSGATILRRKRSGMSDYDAVYSKRITHHNTATKKTVAKYDVLRGINSNQ